MKLFDFDFELTKYYILEQESIRQSYKPLIIYYSRSYSIFTEVVLII